MKISLAFLKLSGIRG